MANGKDKDKDKPVANGIDKDNKDEDGGNVKPPPLPLGVPWQQTCFSLHLVFTHFCFSSMWDTQLNYVGDINDSQSNVICIFEHVIECGFQEHDIDHLK